MNYKRYFKIASLFILILSVFIISSYANDDEETWAVKKKLKSFDSSLGKNEIKDIIEVVGKSLLGTEYVAGTLDKNINTEKLVIKITGLDCVTFVENTLTISRIIRAGNIDFDSYVKELQKIRYRDGEINGYPSRLHYFTDWIYDNEKKGIVQDITQDIGGIPYSKDINFMTSHINSYKQLIDNQEYISELKKIEDDINSRKIFYIKKKDVDKFYDKMQTGDIIATTTDIAGLDVTHTGFILKQNGKTLFMHASITKGEIIISKEELKEYLQGNKKQSGIIIARPL